MNYIDMLDTDGSMSEARRLTALALAVEAFKGREFSADDLVGEADVIVGYLENGRETEFDDVEAYDEDPAPYIWGGQPVDLDSPSFPFGATGATAYKANAEAYAQTVNECPCLICRTERKAKANRDDRIFGGRL